MDGVHAVYGLQVDTAGLPPLERVLLPAAAADPSWRRITVRHRSGPPGHPGVAPRVDGAGALVELPDGRWLEVGRRSGAAVFSGPPLPADDLAHPYLGPPAIVVNRWLGREAFHAGAFVAGGRAWMVVGPRQSGKSSFLGALAGRGTAVLADDISVTDGETVFAGPRCLDLRRPLPGPPVDLVRARGGTRWRLLLPHGPAGCPVGGWLFLRWGDDRSLLPLPPARLVRRLARHRLRAHLRSDPRVLLALANRPAWVLTRPRTWESVPATLAAVDAGLAAVGPDPAAVGR